MDEHQKWSCDFNDFCREIELSIRKMQPQVKLRKVMKNNQVEMIGLDFSDKPGRVTPIIYLEQFFLDYQNGTSVKVILANIMKIFHQRDSQMEVRLQYALKWSFAKQRILYRLVNAERNRELLLQVPHERWLDLALVYYYPVSRSAESCAHITVTEQLLKRWQITPQQLFMQAAQNVSEQLEIRVLPLVDMLKRGRAAVNIDENQAHAGDAEGAQDISNGKNEENSMFVLTNQYQMFGAVGMLNDEVLFRLSEHLRDDLYILPSSIHECIVVPQGTEDAVRIRQLVYEVNRTDVEPAEVLSDSIYLYRKDRRQISQL